MTAGDIGTAISLNASGYVMTGGVATLLVKKVGSSTPAGAYTATIQSGGLTALYITTGAEFPTGGPYDIQLKFTISGSQFSSNVLTIQINSLLT